LLVGGRSLLSAALAAAAGGPIVVVGPTRELPPGVRSAVEKPAGGGPAAAVAAGFQALPPLGPDALVAVLAADLPGISADTLARLRAELVGHPDADGAELVDASGRRQQLIGVWRHAALAAALARRDSWHNGSVRELLSGLLVIEVAGTGGESDDIDTSDDLQRWLGSFEPPAEH
jgi:molybdopterin-guanine dinucleotide biosynthesis protein A